MRSGDALGCALAYSRDGHIVRTENSEKVKLERQKNILKFLFSKKILQIRRDLIESFVEHILDLSGSKSKYQNFFDNDSDKSEKSRIFDDLGHQNHGFFIGIVSIS